MSAVPYFLLASAAIVFGLGSLHLLFTFRGPRFDPRDAALKRRMQEVALVLTGETTVWKAWIGFNASHSLGAILFGAVYAHLALQRPEVLTASPFLLGLGAVLLALYVGLAWAYWFRIPLRGLGLALLLYLLGLGQILLQG
ncbi:hypothetical protein OOT46_13290 [Aquabacterium sp. A7-Y]|uniref:LIC_13387 family protein n=1 Tax=Aquabacterium sp. A7-Y TaxID=1349605 RepID=UPI00223DAB1C|nr:hypothetical protein [Aquabacterium sp. A7-Y]MCW7538816.1 hypothetical protein [Aquabacterium sp. A7-Y]